MDNQLNISSLINALKTLQVSLESPPKNDLERDGVIQRFEHTLEMSWKIIRKTLLQLGRTEVNNSPKPLFKSAYEEGFIDDVSAWLDFVDAKNKTSHDYSLTKADQVYQAAQKFPPYVEHLILQLKKLVDSK